MFRRLLPVIWLVFVLATVSIASSGCVGGDSGPFATPLYIYDPGNPFEQPDRYVVSVFVEPAGVNLVVGGAQQFKALATFNDGSMEYITEFVEWHTENPHIGLFGSTVGRFLAQEPGVAIVRCQITQNTAILVSSASFVNSFNPNADYPPVIPLNPWLTSSVEGVLLSWDLNTTDGDLAGYNVYRTQTYGAHYATDIGKMNSYPILYPPYLDSTVVSGWYYYRITAEDLLGIQSAPSEEISVFITASTHYGSGFDSGTTSAEGENYKDSFSIVF